MYTLSEKKVIFYFILFYIYNNISSKCIELPTSETISKIINKPSSVTLTNYILLCSILLSGESFSKISLLFGKIIFYNLIVLLGFTGINFGSEKHYHDFIVPKVTNVVEKITNQFLKQCCLKTLNKDAVKIIIDAGWSHPGWWARECTVTAIDGSTGLPLAVYHVLKSRNFEGSSKGN